MTAAFATDIGRAALPTTLAGRLPAISPERAAATTRLLAAGDVLIRNDDNSRLELRADVAQEPPPATTIELSHAHGRTSLILTAEHGSATIGDRTWHDFSGDARLLAWTLAYDALVARLSDLLGTPLLPVELQAAPQPSAAVWHWIEFRFTRGDHQECRGLLGLDRSTMATLTAATGWSRGGDGGLHIERDELPLPCHLELPPLVLPAATLRALNVDDVVLLGSRASITSTLRLCVDSDVAAIDTRFAWAAAIALGGIAITRALSPAEIRNDTMTTQNIPPCPDEAGGVAATDVRDAIPVRVELVLDTLQLSLAELGRFSAGQILGLRQPVEGARVSLRANGKTFANGELVALGELLGVKLTRIGDDLGLQ
ncbi:MAG: FliM/FliN family flagellar motor switch protein [Dokdonella sp.]